MIILGMQFGHDGGVSIIKDGKLLSYIYRERFSRVKHAIGITDNELNMALTQANITVEDIDCVAIVSTQNIELLVGALSEFAVRFEPHQHHQCPNPLVEMYKKGGVDIEKNLSYQLTELFTHQEKYKDSLQLRAYSDMCLEKDLIAKGDMRSSGWLDHYIGTEAWRTGRTLENIPAQNIRPHFTEEAMQYGFHYPVSVTLKGKTIAGYYINHHMAHAASSYYRSGFKESAIITHDGFSNGAEYHGGMMFFGKENKITALAPHHLALGVLYDMVGMRLNLGSTGPAGKLMGLAPYGRPVFFHNGWVGNWYNWIARFPNQNPLQLWFSQCIELAQAMGYDMIPLANKDNITAPINADIAASTQKLFEECYAATIRALHLLLLNNQLHTDNLCMSGGTALNCPNNSMIATQSPFRHLYIEPNCGDDGLAIGGAFYAYYHLYNQPLNETLQAHYHYPYAGIIYSDEQIKSTLDRYQDKLTPEKLDNAPAHAAQAIQDNQVIAWFEGQSEFGPRALGHRSIVANPTFAENWERVNRIKGRERWRPFAPSVLEEEAPKWFRNLPAHSPYMLFTGQVASSQLSAITHVDGSSRIQTVSKENGQYYDFIKAFQSLSGIPVVMNTSFNGPSDPIVETPEEAINFLLTTEIDRLYIGGYCVTRKKN